MDRHNKVVEKQLKDLKQKPVSEEIKKSIDKKMEYVNKPIKK